jgi:hypothetical protein
MPDLAPVRLSLALSGPVPSPEGAWEILAITSGLGNGWKFSPAVLQASLPLWDGVHCFLDHALTQRSIRDIAGILTNPTFDAETQGIRASLKPFGPGAEMLTNLAASLSAPDQPDYRIGFSADLSFLGEKQTVKEIIKVHSVDLVVNPARGGKFLRALNHEVRTAPENKGETMPSENTETPDTSEAPSNTPWTEGPHSAPERRVGREAPSPVSESSVGATHASPVKPVSPTSPDTKSQLQQELDQVTALRRQLSSVTLDTVLDASRLPKASIDHLRRQFSGRDFTLDQLNQSIEDQRKLLSDLTASGSIQSHGRVDQVFNETDRLEAAVSDLFEVPREPNQANIKTPRLSGIRELYLALTGDNDLHGGYHADRVQLATTADFSSLVRNALNKIVSNTWDDLGRAGYDWWKDITVQEHFNTLHDITGTLVGTVGNLPIVAEGGPYTELKVGDSGEIASFVKYGGYLPLTLELIDRDDTRKLKSYARELASAGMRKISKLVADIFSSNGGTGPEMGDGEALFNVTPVTTYGGHANLSATALSATTWDTVSRSVYQQAMLVRNEAGMYGLGPQMAINPKFLLVPRHLQKTAMEICTGSFVRESGYVYDNVLKGSAVPVVVPEWTDAADWAAACDPRLAPAVYIGERFGLMPEVYIAGSELSPAVFTNDEHRIKVRHFLAVWVNDFRPLHKCNVA